MKVIFIHPDLGIGGAERLILDIGIALKQNGVESKYITNHFDLSHCFEELRRGNFPVEVYGDWIPRSIFGKCQALCAYIRMFYLALMYMVFGASRDEADVFIVDQIPMANYVLKLFRQNVIYYCHHPDLLATPRDSFLKKLYRMPIDYIEEIGTKLSDVILVNSEYTASIFYETFPSIKKRIHILYPTIASSYMEMLTTINRRPLSEIVPEINDNVNNVIFLSINRFHPAKNLELAVYAFESLQSLVSSEEWNRVYLIIAGGYDTQSSINIRYYEELVELVERKELSNKIIFNRSPPDRTKTELLLACDCLIYTPTNEHFGIVPLEAMAAEKPVIACNSGGPRETVDHTITGYLTEPNPSEMAKYMKKLIDKDNCIAMGKTGKDRLEAKFSYEAFCKNALDALKKFDHIEEFSEEIIDGETGKDSLNSSATITRNEAKISPMRAGSSKSQLSTQSSIN